MELCHEFQALRMTSLFYYTLTTLIVSFQPHQAAVGKTLIHLQLKNLVFISGLGKDQSHK